MSFRRWSDETPGAEPRRLVVTLSLDQRPIFGRIVESLEYRLQRDLIFPGEFFGRERSTSGPSTLHRYQRVGGPVSYSVPDVHDLSLDEQ